MTFFPSLIYPRELLTWPTTGGLSQQNEILDMKHQTLAHFRHFSHFRHSFNYNIFPDTLFYAKQTQCQVRRNERKRNDNNEIRNYGHLVIQTNKAKTNPIQTQFKANKAKNKPNSKPIKPKTNPIQSQTNPKLMLILYLIPWPVKPNIIEQHLTRATCRRIASITDTKSDPVNIRQI